MTQQGFRSAFRELAGETTSFSREVIEYALARQLTDKAEVAYRQGICGLNAFLLWMAGAAIVSCQLSRRRE